MTDSAAPMPASRLAVRRLALSEFRCYTALRLEVGPGPVVLTGPNGAGKTNLLEALSLLVPGRGLRRASLAELTRQGAAPGTPWAVSVRIEDEHGPAEIGTGRDPAGERRVVRIDGRTSRLVDLAGRMAALWVTPAMDRLFSEGGSGRRRFLDRLAFGLESGHAAEAGSYDQAMRERARLLRVARDSGRPADPVWLAALEQGMARHGVRLAANRLTTVARLDRACREGHGPFPAARLAVVGAVEEWLAAGAPPDAAEEQMRATLRAARTRDQVAGATTFGPHRSDLAVRHAARDIPAGQGSTGEQKAVLVAIILAQCRVQACAGGRVPLLLLDEVAAHLDRDRRAALFDTLCALGAQSWLTGTDAPLFEAFGDRAQFFRVADAAVEPGNGV